MTGNEIATQNLRSIIGYRSADSPKVSQLLVACQFAPPPVFWPNFGSFCCKRSNPGMSQPFKFMTLMIIQPLKRPVAIAYFGSIASVHFWRCHRDGGRKNLFELTHQLFPNEDRIGALDKEEMSHALATEKLAGPSRGLDAALAQSARQNQRHQAVRPKHGKSN